MKEQGSARIGLDRAIVFYKKYTKNITGSTEDKASKMEVFTIRNNIQVEITLHSREQRHSNSDIEECEK